MSDLFHEQVPDDFIGQVFGVMRAAHWHIFQILTKRQCRMLSWIALRGLGNRPLPNVWLGGSVEDQRCYDERVEAVRQSGAVVRFLSCEPLLGSIDFGDDFWESGNRVDWVVVGGESGPGHRSMELLWLTSIVEQCRAAQVPVFVKQDAGRYPGRQGRIPDDFWVHEWPWGFNKEE